MKKSNNSLIIPLILVLIAMYSCQNNTKITSQKTTISAATNELKESNKVEIDSNKLQKTPKRINIVVNILTTSPSFINKTKGLNEAVIKNGGTSYGYTIEGSPNPKKDNAISYSETYDFNLHESYPDRMTIIARYTFDPAKKQLYLYDTVEDSLNSIDFDKKLLLQYNKSKI